MVTVCTKKKIKSQLSKSSFHSQRSQIYILINDLTALLEYKKWASNGI